MKYKDFEKVFKQLYFDKYHKKDLTFKYYTLNSVDMIIINNSKSRIVKITIDENKIETKGYENFKSFIKENSFNFINLLIFRMYEK